jgi:hypothetical protein
MLLQLFIRISVSSLRCSLKIFCICGSTDWFIELYSVQPVKLLTEDCLRSSTLNVTIGVALTILIMNGVRYRGGCHNNMSGTSWRGFAYSSTVGQAVVRKIQGFILAVSLRETR